MVKIVDSEGKIAGTNNYNKGKIRMVDYIGEPLGTMTFYEDWQIEILGHKRLFTFLTTSKLNSMTRVTYETATDGFIPDHFEIYDMKLTKLIGHNISWSKKIFYIHNLNSQRPKVEWYEGEPGNDELLYNPRWPRCSEVLSQEGLRKKIAHMIPLSELKEIEKTFYNFKNSKEFKSIIRP